MSDRLTLANAIEEALVSVAGHGTVAVDTSIVRAKAERIASTIVDLIHDNVATKVDIAELRAATKADIAELRAVDQGGHRRAEGSDQGGHRRAEGSDQGGHRRAARGNPSGEDGPHRPHRTGGTSAVHSAWQPRRGAVWSDRRRDALVAAARAMTAIRHDAESFRCGRMTGGRRSPRPGLAAIDTKSRLICDEGGKSRSL